MTTITQNVTDIAGANDNTSWTFYTEQIRQYGAAIVSTKKIRKYPVAGVLTVVLDPGPAVVVAPDGKKYPFTVPVTDSDLWTLIAGAIGMPPGTTQQAIAAAVADYLNAHQIDEYHEYANLAAFPGTGVLDRLYLAQDTGKIYRWNGSAYVQIADKAAVGLGNVDNTSDVNKPVSTAQQTALDLKAPLASPAFTGTPTGITKTHVGLGNVDNTSDTAKPVSTAQAAALNGKQPLDTSPMGNGPFAGVLTHLNHNRSTIIQGLGDSTVYGVSGNTGGWIGRIGDILGSYYDASVWMCLWNDTNQSYDPPVVRRTSTQGERVAPLITASATVGSQYTAASVTGDIEIIVKATLTTWNSGLQCLVGKWGLAGGTTGFGFFSNSGAPQLYWSPDGTTLKNVSATANVPFSNGSPGWVRCTLQVNNGSSGNTVKFYTSTDGITWTQLGSSVVTAGTTSIFDNSTIPYQLGSVQGSTLSFPAAGSLTWVQVRNALANGQDMVPVLPECWDATTFNYPTVSGGPTILIMNGGKAGGTLSYLDDNTRRPKMLTNLTPDVIFIGDGHNDSALSQTGFAAAYLTYVNDVKTYRPNVPVITTTQNPTLTSGSGTDLQSSQNRLARTGRMATVMAAQPGVTVLDTCQAYTDLSTQVNSTDGIHPTDAGYQAQANWMAKRLAPGSV